MSSDTWSDIQALKSKQNNLRERLARRKKERQDKLNESVSPGQSPVTGVSASTGPVAGSADSPANTKSVLDSASPPLNKTSTRTTPGNTPGSVDRANLSTDSSPLPWQQKASEDHATSKANAQTLAPDLVQEIEKRLLLLLSDVTLILPTEVSNLIASVKKQLNMEIPKSTVEDLMHKFSAQMLLNLENKADEKTGIVVLMVDSVDHNKLTAVTNEMDCIETSDVFPRKRKKDIEEDTDKNTKQSKTENDNEDLIENLLSMESAKQRESKKTNDEILQLLSKPTAKEQSLIEKFKSQGGAQVREFCPNGTKEECTKVTVAGEPCVKLHFRKIINKHTDESLGDCSFLNTCFHMDTCKYVHYEIDYPKIVNRDKSTLKKASQEGSTILFPQQWIQCDLRSFDMTVLGKFAVVMADPPWDIHMELPYGTMSDDEMRKLQVPVLQDEGYIFLWVTGRAMELGRECLQLWGYERVDELIWVKTNQLQRIIRTGRTGHWLNHGKEHCLIGVKGNPKTMNRGLDCDVIVAEVRATSHKPDEIYGIIERLSPGTRKIELFGRPHNVQRNWFTLGNQLDGVKLNEPDVVKAFKARYPDGNCVGKS